MKRREFNPRCPKCGGTEIDVTEFSLIPLVFCIADGKIYDSFPEEEEAEPVRVSAFCVACKHQWRVPVSRFSDFLQELDERRPTKARSK